MYLYTTLVAVRRSAAHIRCHTTRRDFQQLVFERHCSDNSLHVYSFQRGYASCDTYRVASCTTSSIVRCRNYVLSSRGVAKMKCDC